MIRKKEELKRSYETQDTNETRSFTNLYLTQILKLSKSCSSWLNGKMRSLRRFRRWFHLIWTNELKVTLVLKSGAKSR